VPKQTRHACHFLRSNKKIAGYLAAIERNTELLLGVRRALPTPLDERCLHATLDSGSLTLVTDSPVWSSRLRFFAPELARALEPHFGPISACRIRVQPQAATFRTDAKKAPGQKISRRTVHLLFEAAAAIEDAELSAALRRLARAGASRDN
jgi:hypothetical protein